MNRKKIIAVLAALAIAGTVAGCSKSKTPEQSGPGDAPSMPSFETEAPVESNSQQTVGKVTAIDGSKITIELGELKQRTPSKDGNGGDGSKRERPSDRDGKKPDGNGNGDSKDRPNFSFGYTFNATGGTASYDLSGLKQITLENDDDDTADTIEEIKTGDVVVITVDKSGNPESLTVKALNGRRGSGSGRSGGSRKDRDGDGNRSERTSNKDRNKSRNDRNDDEADA